jgi:hypothetical protein
MRYPFNLLPFAAKTLRFVEDLAVSGWIERQGTLLTLHYDLQGTLILPPLTNTPQRCDGLWQTTCCEWFMALPGATAYWEVNLSPNGNWNCYRFEGYRQGMVEERAIAMIPIAVACKADALHLEVTLDVSALFTTADALEVGITAVLDSPEQGVSYWALSHPGAEPDFHRREGFALTV